MEILTQHDLMAKPILKIPDECLIQQICNPLICYCYSDYYSLLLEGGSSEILPAGPGVHLNVDGLGVPRQPGDQGHVSLELVSLPFQQARRVGTATLELRGMGVTGQQLVLTVGFVAIESMVRCISVGGGGGNKH